MQDLIIEVIYADIIHGKLDQKNQQLEVDYAIGRDIRPTAITQMISVLQEWWDNLVFIIASYLLYLYSNHLNLKYVGLTKVFWCDNSWYKDLTQQAVKPWDSGCLQGGQF